MPLAVPADPGVADASSGRATPGERRPAGTLGAVASNHELECWAAWIAAAALGGRPTRRDVPGTSGAHDYDVCLDDRVVALEVTRAAVEKVHAQRKAIDDGSWGEPGLTSSWDVQVEAATSSDPGARIRTLATKAPALLARLEALGVSHVGPVPGALSSDEVIAAERELRALGVQSASSSGLPPAGEAARLYVGTLGVAGVLDGTAVNEAVERAARDNAAKLATAAADERHLFVWADWSDGAVEAALLLGRVAGQPPELGDGIDAVWVATWAPGVAYHCHASRLWRASAGGTWRFIPPPDVHAHVERVTGDGSARAHEDSASGLLRHGLLERGNALRRRLGLPSVSLGRLPDERV